MKVYKGLEQHASKFEILEEREHSLNVDKDARKIVSETEKNCGEGKKGELDDSNSISNQNENGKKQYKTISGEGENQYKTY